MNGLAKFSYILLGIGIGIIGTSIVYEKELKKPLFEDEDYIPEGDAINDDEEDEENLENVNETDEEADIVENYKSSIKDEEDNILEYYKSSIKDDGAHTKNRNMRTRYSKMYRHDSTPRPLSEIEQEYLDYIQENPPEDEPENDEDLTELEDQGLTVELVEPNFAIYIGGDIPQDYAELRWYNYDNTLTDDRDEIIPNPSEVIGNVSIDRLIDRGAGAEDGVIYVRNMKTSINYEITFCASSYSRTVLGIFESRRKGAKGDGGQ